MSDGDPADGAGEPADEPTAGSTDDPLNKSTDEPTDDPLPEPTDEPESATADPATDTVLTLPESLRQSLKAPMGPVFETVEELLGPPDDPHDAAAGGPVITVGDVVTAALLRAERPPALAVVDGRTKRQPVAAAAGSAVAAALDTLPSGHVVANPAGTYTAGLLETLSTAIRALPAAPDPQGPEDVVVVDVDGEEDLAVLPAIAVAPDGASVLYGQPGEGMVRVDVDAEARADALDLLEQFEGEFGRAERLLGLG